MIVWIYLISIILFAYYLEEDVTSTRERIRHYLGIFSAVFSITTGLIIFASYALDIPREKIHDFIAKF